MSDTPVQGEPTDLADMVRQVERRNSVLVRLATGVEQLASQVTSLRREVNDRPTKEAVAARRRRSLALMVLYGVVIIWGHDTHVEYCSPGAQAAAVLDYVADEPGRSRLTPKTIERIVDDAQPTAACDVSFPLHAHGVGVGPMTQPNGSGEYAVHAGPLHLTRWNVVGFAVYGFVGGILFLWQRGLRRPSTHRKDSS